MCELETEIGLADIGSLAWEKQGGLLPAIVQDQATLRVLMLGYMSSEALQRTLDCGRATFFSRSRNALWEKGETSGNSLNVVSVKTDCDRDTLLVIARPAGPTCHRGTTSCFDGAPADFPAELDALISSRFLNRPQDSYTTSLIESGIRRMAQKVGEEGVEVALAGAGEDDPALLDESADLVFHLMVLLRARGMAWDEVVERLRGRHIPR